MAKLCEIFVFAFILSLKVVITTALIGKVHSDSNFFVFAEVHSNVLTIKLRTKGTAEIALSNNSTINEPHYKIIIGFTNGINERHVALYKNGNVKIDSEISRQHVFTGTTLDTFIIFWTGTSILVHLQGDSMPLLSWENNGDPPLFSEVKYVGFRVTKSIIANRNHYEFNGISYNGEEADWKLDSYPSTIIDTALKALIGALNHLGRNHFISALNTTYTTATNIRPLMKERKRPHNIITTAVYSDEVIDEYIE